jgi:hypothetical protein
MNGNLYTFKDIKILEIGKCHNEGKWFFHSIGIWHEKPCRVVFNDDSICYADGGVDAIKWMNKSTNPKMTSSELLVDTTLVPVLDEMFYPLLIRIDRTGIYLTVKEPKDLSSYAAHAIIDVCCNKLRPEPSFTNHYDWLDAHLDRIWITVTGKSLKQSGNAGIIVAHGDKCRQYEQLWKSFGIHFHIGATIYLLSYDSMFDGKVRETATGFIKPSEWVVDNYNQFNEQIRKALSSRVMVYIAWLMSKGITPIGLTEEDRNRLENEYTEYVKTSTSCRLVEVKHPRVMSVDEWVLKQGVTDISKMSEEEASALGTGYAKYVIEMKDKNNG